MATDTNIDLRNAYYEEFHSHGDDHKTIKMKRREFIETNTKLIMTLPFLGFGPTSIDKLMNENIYKLQIGKFQCTIYKDLMFKYLAKDYFINADKQELNEYLKKYQISEDNIPSPYISMLLQDGQKKILVDSGIGFSEKPINFRGKEFVLKGQLSKLLKEEGIDRNEITDVIVTHFHPDHIGGIYSSEKKLNYPNAKFHFHEKEWDFWHSSKSNNQPPLFKYFIEENITPLKNGNVNLIKDDFQEICEGVKTVNAEGHTAGQIGLIIGDETEQLLYISDAFLHPIHMERLDWQTNFDSDHEKAKSSRKKLLDLAYSNNMKVNAFHFDFPGMGRIDKEKQHWKWIYEK